MAKHKTSPRFSAEVRERAVRMVSEHRAEHSSQWSVIASIAAKIGCTERLCPLGGAPGRVGALSTVTLLTLCLGATTGIAQDGEIKRFVSEIPAAVPAGYAALLVLGLLGTPLARTWWPRVWPPETAADYAGRAGYWAACGVRFLAFALIFLPLTAVVAAPWSLGGQIWELARGPLRGLWRIAGWAARRRKTVPASAQAETGGKPAQSDTAVEAPAAPVQMPPPAPPPVPPAHAPAPMAAPPPPAGQPAGQTPPVLPMPPPTRVPSAPPPSAPAMPAPAMSAPPKPPPVPPPPAKPARAKRSKRDKPAKPARSWIANLPKDEDME